MLDAAVREVEKSIDATADKEAQNEGTILKIFTVWGFA